MTILLVDDQQAILEGLLSGVPFDQIGFDRVLTAGDAAEAWQRIQDNQIDVLLTDIEMPGENGLDLIKRVTGAFPEMLCIPLTSHASFEFAKESLRLGCFDYLVQPAPYEDIAACLRKAFDAKVRQAQQELAQHLGSYVQSNEPGVTGQMVMQLYSADPADVAEALQYLNASGYMVDRSTPARLCIAVDMPYFHRLEGRLSMNSILTILRDSFMLAEGHPVALITRNSYRQFVLLLCHSDGISPPPCTEETCRQAMEEMTRRLGHEPAFYFGPETTVGQARGLLPELHMHVDNNVTERTGVIQATAAAAHTNEGSGGLEMTSRWQTLLDQEKYDLLYLEIEASVQQGREGQSLRGLASLHQRLTRMLFEHLQARKIEIMSLFSREHTYAMYMDSFRTVGAFLENVRYLLDAAARQRNIVQEQSDVERAKTYIYAHLDQPVLVTEVAAHVNLSSEYFTKLFKRETGQNIKDFITQAKIHGARELLAHSDIPVSLVAMELGYDNFSHFSQIFRKICGVSPSDYRRMQREGKV